MYVKDHQSSKGFTLIELIVVIVILGIIGVAATAKFQELDRETRIAFLQGVQASMTSASNMVFAQSAINGQLNGADNMPYAGTNISIHSGYPEGHWNNTWRYILITDSRGSYTPAGQRCTGYPMCGVGNRTNIRSVSGTSGGRGVYIWLDGYRINEDCFAYYYNRHDGGAPMIGTVISGC
jgi:MSHA pilin protein MshA